MSDDLDLAPAEEPAHSIYSPSSSAGWAFCAGFLRANMGLPDDAGVDAAYGTVSHELTEQWLVSGEMPRHRLGEVVVLEEGQGRFEIEIDAEMLDYVRDCVGWVEGIEGEKYVETRVDFSDLTPLPRQKGTCDLAFCKPGKLTIRDWKFGKGVQVFVTTPDYDPLDPERHTHLNPQVMLYAYGFFREWDWLYGFEEISIGIGQPRLDHWQTIEIKRGELLAFAEWIKGRAHAAWEHDAPRTPSPKSCQWCKVKGTCAALTALQHRMVDGSFDDLTLPVTGREMAEARARIEHDSDPMLPGVGRMTTAELAKILPYRRTMENWFIEIEAELIRRANLGPVPGYKLVEGRSHRHWAGAEADEVEEQLRALGLRYSQIWTAELISPAQAEEKLKATLKIGKKRASQMLAPLVVKPAGRLTLVREEDSRPPQLGTIEGTFEDLSDDL